MISDQHLDYFESQQDCSNHVERHIQRRERQRHPIICRAHHLVKLLRHGLKRREQPLNFTVRAYSRLEAAVVANS